MDRRSVRCDYLKLWILISLVTLALGALCLYAASALRAGSSRVFYIGGGLLLLTALIMMVRAKNERISVENGRILWTDWLGRSRVDCELTDVVKGSLKRSHARRLYKYVVETSEGMLRWQSTMSNSDMLFQIIRDAGG